MLLTAVGYLISFIVFNKQLNCTCCVSYFGLKGIILSQDIFDYYSIIEEVNPELQVYIEFTKRSLSLQAYQFTLLILKTSRKSSRKPNYLNKFKLLYNHQNGFKVISNSLFEQNNSH